MVTLGKERYPVTTTWAEEGLSVEIEGGETVVLGTDWRVGEPVMLAHIGGNEVTVQVCGGGEVNVAGERGGVGGRGGML